MLGTKVAYLSLINVGSGFHCLRSFSFLFLSCEADGGIFAGLISQQQSKGLQMEQQSHMLG